jgi:hypothetical protein
VFLTEHGTDPITFTHARSWFDKLTLSLSQTTSEHYLALWGMKPTVLD